MKRDLTQGSIFKNLIYMAVPTMLGFMAHTFYDLVDMIWVGRISKEAVAAVTVFATLYWLAFVLNNIIGQSSVALISQSYGSGDTDETKRVIEQTFVFKGLLAVIASLIMAVSLRPLLSLFTKDALVLQAAMSYGIVRIIGLPISFSSLTVNTALRCTGDAKRSMNFMVFSAFLNVLLDPIFMFERVPFIGLPGLGLGVMGAALATEISAAIAFLWGSWMLFSGRSFVQPSLMGLLRLDRRIAWKLISIGAPNGLDSLLRNLSQTIMLGFISSYGTVVLASLGIVHRLMGFAFMPLEGLYSGGSTIVGQNLGVNNVERAEQTARTASLMGFCLMACFAVFLYAFPGALLSLFTQDAGVISTGTRLLYIFIPGLLFAGLMLGMSSSFGGSGYNLPFLVASIVARWAVQLPYLLIVVSVLHLPITFVALAFPLTDFTEMVIMGVAFKQGKWKNKRVTSQKLEEPVPVVS